MILALHGLSTMFCNIKTEIRLARENGFDGLEIEGSQLLRYMDSGHTLEELRDDFISSGIKPVCINALKGIEVQEVKSRNSMLETCRKLCKAAEIIGCQTIQVVPFASIDDRPIEEILELTAMNLRKIADIGKQHGVRFQLEPLAFAPICSLKLSLQLLNMCNRDNLGMVIDFWHLWAGGDTEASEVAKLDKNIIYGVHFCDGIRKAEGEEWNEGLLRSYLPGDGDINISEWVSAVKSTNYDGYWSGELCSPYYWENDILELICEIRERMKKYIMK